MKSSSMPTEIASLLAPARGRGELGWLGPYRVLKVLGQGGMGVVFHAEDPQLERPVALKAILPRYAANPHARARFLREARASALLKHDHIVAIYQVGEDRGIPYQAMEYLEGQSLEQYLKRKQQMPLVDALRIGRDIAEGLAEAHEHGLIHRDVKPGNVWLEKKKKDASSGLSAVRVKILDFGLARDNNDDSSLTQLGTIIGTPSYMSPEQAKAETVEDRSDLFSLGCVLYRLCTGQLPFRGDSAAAILTSIALDKPVPPSQLNSDVPPVVSDYLLKLLEKEPKRRPASAREVSETLQKLMREVKRASKAEQSAAAESPPPESSRRTWRWILALLVLAAAAAGITLFVWRRGELQTVVPAPTPEDKKPPSKEPPPKQRPKKDRTKDPSKVDPGKDVAKVDRPKVDKSVSPPRVLNPILAKLKQDKIAPKDLTWAFGTTDVPVEVVGLVRNQSTPKTDPPSLNGFALSPDCQWLTQGGPGFDVQTSNLQTGSMRFESNSHKTIGYAFADTALITASSSGELFRRALTTANDRTLAEPPAKIKATSFDAGGADLYFLGTERGDVYVVLAGNPGEKPSTVVHKGQVNPIKCVLYAPATGKVISVDDRGIMLVSPLMPKDKTDDNVLLEFPIEGKRLRQASLGPTPQIVLMAFDRVKSVYVIAIDRKGRDAEQVGEFETGADVSAFALSPDNRTLATISPRGLVQLWNYATRKKIGEIELPGSNPPRVPGVDGYRPLQFASDGVHLLVGHPRGAVVVVRISEANDDGSN